MLSRRLLFELLQQCRFLDLSSLGFPLLLPIQGVRRQGSTSPIITISKLKKAAEDFRIPLSARLISSLPVMYLLDDFMVERLYPGVSSSQTVYLNGYKGYQGWRRNGMQCCRRSRAIRGRSTPWPSRRTARRWRRGRATRQSSCGTPGRARCCRRSRAIRGGSTPWPFGSGSGNIWIHEVKRIVWKRVATSSAYWNDLNSLTASGITERNEVPGQQAMPLSVLGLFENSTHSLFSVSPGQQAVEFP